MAHSDLASNAATALSGPGHDRIPDAWQAGAGRRDAVPAGGVRATALRLHVSERHLRNVFSDAVGLSPNRFARIDRVRAALSAADTGLRWASIASAAGFYDRAHLTAEFRALMGVSPGAFRAGRLPAAGQCGMTVVRDLAAEPRARAGVAA
ncbi:helix-turn-helix domain-containing protein [Crossiella sp. CA198]|uniref:helix-turn-helix domain-containing protein n=1 Tax=Crossiella sp. CA198 TaxID=3455607 RepID=UPI003F8CFABA